MKNTRKVLIIALLSTKALIASQPTVQVESNDVWVNVFIHGIIKPVVTIGDIIKIADQRLKKSRYKFVTKYIRKHNVLHRAQAMQEIGLRQIDMKPNPNNNGSRALVATYKHLKQAIGQDHAKELYYTFGWSGLLSYSSRQKAAYFLHHKLVRLMDQLKNKGLNPKLRIIAFSHGGNVALQLANIEPWNEKQIKLPVDQLITLGTPVHKENDVLVRHPMFKKIYHFYSNSDMAQKVDFLSTQYISSHRRYHPRRCFNLPTKLTQIQVSFSKTPRKRPMVPFDENGKIIYDPNHIEMWSFGWTPRGYDKRMPIFPIPTAGLVPYIIDKLEKTPKLGRNLSLDINPDKETATFTDRYWDTHKTKKTVTVPFLTKKDFDQVKLAAWTRRPDKHQLEDLQRTINQAVRFATRQRKLQKHCSKSLNCGLSNCVPKLYEF